VNRRRVLVGLVIDGQSGGHGVTLIDLSSQPGEAHEQKSSVSALIRHHRQTVI
jgi:hypothetical protein